jgi:hypothetical protein
MTPFEWLGELLSPRPIGTVEVGGQPRRRRRIDVIGCFVFAVVMLALWAYFVLAVWQVRSPWGLAGLGLGTVLYVVLGYFVHAKPNTANLGKPGTKDHPYRISDDLNRVLLTVWIVLLPARLIAESFVDLVRLMRPARNRPV